MSLQKFDLQNYSFFYTNLNFGVRFDVKSFNNLFDPSSFFYYEGIKVFRKRGDKKIPFLRGFFNGSPIVYFSYSLPSSFILTSFGGVFFEYYSSLTSYNSSYVSSFSGPFSYDLYSGTYGGSLVSSFTSFEDAFNYCLLNLDILYYPFIVRCIPDLPSYTAKYETWSLYLLLSPFSCCQPDFAPIVKTLGGTPLEEQNDNLKLICQLFGVDTSENGLTDCDLMKDYLKRLVSFFGCSPSDEPNDNLKSICQFLGVDTSENGLKDCDLSKHYVKQISNMLGGTNA